jgi:phospholipid/cholesterol/gamma-HCH transport system substrate-binding protein
MHSKLETLIGFVVIIIAVGFAWLTYNSSASKKYSGNSYKAIAKFDQIEGVFVGTDVKISGISVGTVTDVALDPNTYGAIITMAIKNNIHIPDDSSAQITTEGLLKSKYIAILAGSSNQMIQPGGEIKFTQSSISLESMISKLLYNFSQK